MRCTVLGGGPAGLYAALLLKRSSSRHEVTVFERNAPTDTFGFGVVFSDQTLGNLRDADPASFDEITAAFAHWDAIDISYRGEVVRAGGNAFAGIRRLTLLEILRRRAEELGVEMRYRTEVADPEALGGADLVLAADGVNSVTREHFKGTFRPTTSAHATRFIWLGTTKVFDAFTFIFREHGLGRFQVHAYPFDAGTSTFIVECDEDSWRRAGLDTATEAESVAWCQEMFAPELDGHPLLANRSAWLRFVTLRAARWHHEQYVLLGDAAHTAHFTIGSGTKLAMEDAIALVQALEQYDRVEAALAAYEGERRPVVERTQDAAVESSQWFESYRRWLGFEPPQFAFSLLARSRRVSHDNLLRRDPAFVNALDRLIAARAAGAIRPADLEVAVPPSLTPFTVGPLHLPNRIVSAPPTDWDGRDGLPSGRWRDALERAGAGGAALVLAELVAVAPEARVTPGCAGIWDDQLADGWARVAAAVHDGGARFALQLGHAGPRGATRARVRGADVPLGALGWPLVAASAQPWAPRGVTPAALGPGDMAAVARAFAAAAQRAAGAGVDALELHFGHGYLLASFLSPLTNRRDDGCGGTIDARLRFPLEVLAAVRAVWPSERALAVRFSAADWAPGGLEEREAVTVARALKAAGCDLLDVVAGQTTAKSTGHYERGMYAPLADLVRNDAGIAVLTSGNIRALADIDTLVAAGRADLCILGRPVQREPAWFGRLGAGGGGEERRG